MERVIASLDDKVDYYLHKISVTPGLTMHPRDLYEVPVLDAETYLLDQVMLEKGLLKIDRDSRVISTKGLEIANFGGWNAYKRQLHKDRFKTSSRSDLEKQLGRDIQLLQQENEELKKELQRRDEKEAATILIIKSLVQQNRTHILLQLLAGVAVGFILGYIIGYF